MSKQRIPSGGVGLPMVLFLIFLILKLTGTVAWSWWWVTAPLWIPAGLCLAVALVCFAIAGVLSIINLIK